MHSASERWSYFYPSAIDSQLGNAFQAIYDTRQNLSLMIISWIIYRILHSKDTATIPHRPLVWLVFGLYNTAPGVVRVRLPDKPYYFLFYSHNLGTRTLGLESSTYR
jgi:hypothetical protein